MIVERNEGTAARRAVPFRLFTSNGTSPDTGASGDSIIMAINSIQTIVVDSLVSAIHAAQGMYGIVLNQSDVSVLGNHPLYHTQGSFPQHVATVNVVNSNPYSTQSNVANVTIATGSYSGVTIQGVSNVSTAAQVADQFLARSIIGGGDSGRSVGQALAVLRNRVALSASIGTVFSTDDSTSMWTFSVTTVAAVSISDINPAG